MFDFEIQKRFMTKIFYYHTSIQQYQLKLLKFLRFQARPFYPEFKNQFDLIFSICEKSNNAKVLKQLSYISTEFGIFKLPSYFDWFTVTNPCTLR